MESHSSSSSSAPLHKSRVRVHKILSMSPLQTDKPIFTSLLSVFFLFLFINFTTTTSAPVTQGSDFEPLYAQHCNGIVPKSDTDPSSWFVTNLSILDIGFEDGYFTGGDRLFAHLKMDDFNSHHRALSFAPNDVGKTLTQGIFKVRGTLRIRDFYTIGDSTRRNLRLVYHGGPRTQFRRGLLNLKLDGYYSESSKKLCMVGKGGSGCQKQ